MVRSIVRDIEKWKNKISGENRKNLYDKQKSSMVAQEKECTEILVSIENQVKQICTGVSSIQIHFYMAFAKEIYSKSRKHSSQNLINEIIILEEKWRARGLDDTLLEKIKMFFVQAYKVQVYFTLDSSLLDGTHILA